MLGSLETAAGGGMWIKALMVGALALAVVMVLRTIGPGAAFAGETMSVADAHAKAQKGEITLVDVRTPDEWKQTGVPASAHTITMHQPGPALLKQLDDVLGGDRSKPLAIICRTGNRTGSLAGPLEQAGFKKVINVAEGLAGGRNGPGWAKTGLPIRSWAPGKEKPAMAASN
jgi:rhodanese-related sulfurtransferase